MLAKTSECFHSLAFLTRNQPLTVISAQSFYLETSIFLRRLIKNLSKNLAKAMIYLLNKDDDPLPLAFSGVFGLRLVLT